MTPTQVSETAVCGRKACTAFLLCLATAIVAPAQKFTTITSFNGTNGADPYSAMVQGFNGNYYGTTLTGGANNSSGTVFQLTPAGKLTTVYSFCAKSGCTDGLGPYGGLVQATTGNLYGTTFKGGTYDYGSVFEVTPAGKLTTLYSFCPQSGCPDGDEPYSGLVQATNGNFYGTTSAGGAYSRGTVFEITPAGILTTLYSFCPQSGCPDGNLPYAGLVQATNGNFYGTTNLGGANGVGTVFEITAKGKLTTLYSFCSQSACSDGKNPYAALVQARNGNLYGTATNGGNNGSGTVFEVTPGGKLTTVYRFCSKSGCADGYYPYGAVVQGTDGNFYGTTTAGGTGKSGGTVFKVTPAGKLTTLHSFCSQTNCPDGQVPYAGVMQATTGIFYGSTFQGGANNQGTLFSESVGLGQFVETLFTSGKVGAPVVILGNNLTGSTAVSFNGTAAKFTVVSATEIKTAVPNGSTTGSVTVTVPGGKLTSNAIFRVTPQILSFQPPSGPVGTVVTIMGDSLTQTTKVTFGGVAATDFTVNSDTRVTATVPTGAKTGKIAITTKGGTAVSADVFTVTQ
jgi:uncharacterized repeat protein (TIGR03803 family)